MNGAGSPVYPWHRKTWEALRSGPVPAALLLRGLRGIGKGDFARALAAALLCESPRADGEACGACDACGWFRAGNHPDFRLLTPESELAGESPDDPPSTGDRKPGELITIAQVRALGEFVANSSHRRGLKVVLVIPADSLNVNAANALLKTLEEPPDNTVFLLVTAAPRRLPATVLSRCRSVVLSPPSSVEAAAWLAERGVAEPALPLAQAGGAPLEALALAQGDLDAQRRSFLQALSRVPVDPVAVTDTLGRIAPLTWVGWMQTWCYDLISQRLTGRTLFHTDFEAVQQRLAESSALTRLLDWEQSLRAARRSARHPLNARLFSEDLLLQYRAVWPAKPTA